MRQVRRALAVVGVALGVGLAVMVVFGEHSAGGQASESAPQPFEDAATPDALNDPVPPDATPQAVSVGGVRHVDPSTLATAIPDVPQEAPLPHAPKTPTGDPARVADAELQAPDAP